MKYFKSLCICPSKEVPIMAELVKKKVRTSTGLNLLNIYLEFKVYPWTVLVFKIKEILVEKERMGETDVWKCWLFHNYIDIRDKLRGEFENTDYIDLLITSLCTS